MTSKKISGPTKIDHNIIRKIIFRLERNLFYIKI